MKYPRLTRQTWLRSAAALAAMILLYILSLLVFGTVTDWRPAKEIGLQTNNEAEEKTVATGNLSFVIWNLGYGGLGAESDFFYDSGHLLFSGSHQVRTPHELVEKNVRGILSFVEHTKADFFLFQEVDFHARRSYGINQFQRIAALLPGYYSAFAPNYQVRHVPIPVLQPWNAYGQVNSGLATYSRWQPDSSVRYQLPGEFGWPSRVFQLDRCIALHRYRWEGNDKELIVMNIHHSAHDHDGALKKQEMAFFRELCLQEYQKGNYVIAGGDWNQVPPYFRFDSFMPGKTQGYTEISIDPTFLPEDWRWVYDPLTPTNRKTKEPYQPGETFITVIDYFLISPNVRVKMVKGLDLQFQFSDHQPVYMEVELVR